MTQDNPTILEPKDPLKDSPEFSKDHIDRPDFLKDPVRNYPDRMRRKSIVSAEFPGLTIDSPDLKNNENPEFFLEKVDLYYDHSISRPESAEKMVENWKKTHNEKKVEEKPVPKPKIDYQFKKTGPLSAAVVNPWAPCITKPPSIKQLIDVLNDNTVTMNKLLKTIKSPLDCPIDVIKEINALPITERRKALYYRALYQSVHKFNVGKDFTLGDMYEKYYAEDGLRGAGYSVFEKNIIRNCKSNSGLIVDLYKREFFTYSKWN